NALQANTGRIVQKLIAAGLQRAWDPGRPINNAFYDLFGATDGTFNTALNNPTIPLTNTRTLLRGMLGARISGKMAYSVAFQRTPPFSLTQTIPLFARPNNSLPNYPSGFEVKIVGPAGNRQVFSRVMLMAHYGRTYETQQATVVTAARF
ncbi:MAG: hypothetical protein ACLGH0_08255, partial [Thermoanaerobaculia bacterium]